MKRKFVLLLLASLLITANVALITAQDSSDKNQEEIIIIYDEGHEQYFTNELMATALSSLNTSLDTRNTDYTVQLILQTDDFNRTNLQGSDLVIISNPGLKEEYDSAALGVEAIALGEYLRIGGSILYMSNPLSSDQNITGHGFPLNELIEGNSADPNLGASVYTVGATSVGDEDNTTLVLDDLNNAGQDQYVKIGLNSISPEVLRTETQNLTNSENPYLVYYGSRILEASSIPGAISGNTSQYAYVVNKNYDVQFFQESPRWLYGEDLPGDQGRAALVGSTIMFSELAFDESSKWIEQGANLPFFQNLVAWLLEITPIPEEQPIVTAPFSFFIRTNILATIIIGLGFIFLSFVYFIFYKRRMKPSEVLDIFEGRESSSKSRQEKKSKTSGQKSQTKRERRKRT